MISFLILNRRRERYVKDGCQSLFLDNRGNRIGLNSFDRLFKKYAVAAGLHTGDELENSFTPTIVDIFYNYFARKRYAA
jgi:hypothetical protein